MQVFAAIFDLWKAKAGLFWQREQANSVTGTKHGARAGRRGRRKKWDEGEKHTTRLRDGPIESISQEKSAEEDLVSPLVPALHTTTTVQLP